MSEKASKILRRVVARMTVRDAEAAWRFDRESRRAYVRATARQRAALLEQWRELAA